MSNPPVMWCLDVSFPYNHEANVNDDAVRAAVGRDHRENTTAFGKRELGFWFDTEYEAKTAERRVLARCHFVRTTTIWSTQSIYERK